MTKLEKLHEIYVGETPRSFTQRMPPPERQPLPGENRHRPITEDIKAMRESQRLGLIVGPPWTNTFRKLMSDRHAMKRLKESFPARWALAKMYPEPGDTDYQLRVARWRILYLYLGSNYPPELIAALQGRKTAEVGRELERAAREAMRLIGPLGERFVGLFPERVAKDLRERGVA